eukprot:3970638-Amphidinium_carterae.1
MLVISRQGIAAEGDAAAISCNTSLKASRPGATPRHQPSASVAFPKPSQVRAVLSLCRAWNASRTNVSPAARPARCHSRCVRLASPT